jgi:thymidylate synthase
MDMLQFVIRNGMVHARIIFRSQDMLLGLPENQVGAAALLGYVVDGINAIADFVVEPGQITIVSLIPHIYKRRDGKEFDMMRAHIDAQKRFGKWKVEVTE